MLLRISMEKKDITSKDKQDYLYRKYSVKKLTDPTKDLDCMVLEWDDFHARVALKTYADSVNLAGRSGLAKDIYKKLEQYGYGLNFNDN